MTISGEGRERELAAERRGRIPADTLANRLMLARALAGHLSIREAADLCGLGRGAWTKWERGTRPADVLEIVPIIAEKLDVDEHWLLWGGPLESSRGRAVTKRATPDRNSYPRSPTRPGAGRPKGRTDRPFPISAQIGLARRAVRVNPDRIADAA